MTRALRTTLATVIAVLACWFVPTSAATAAAPAAVDCPPLDLDNATAVQESADLVTDVFAGTVREVVPVTSVGGGEGKANQDNGDAPSNKPDARVTSFDQTVTVAVPFRSDLATGDRIKVVTEPAGDDGFGRLTEGAVYVFFASEKAGGVNGLVVEACSGTQMLQGGLGAPLQKFLEETLAEEPEDTPPSYTLATPEDGARSTPALGRLAAPGAAVALIGVLGLVVLSRVGARRS